MNQQQLVAQQEPSQLFHHLPKYQVVICTACRYAVPPRAVNRHLKEIHGVHHSLRPNFVKFVENLDLRKPEEVTPPDEDDFPIPELPVFCGLQCNFVDCGHLCLTEKRMKSHWASGQHAYGEMLKPWRSVPVQTFFRGNLLKYFSNISQPGDPELKLNVAKYGGGCTGEPINLSCDWKFTNELPQLPITFSEGQCIHTYNIAESLIQHYRTSTYATITTNINDQVLWQQFWKNTVSQLARKHEFLWLAILALTSLHLAHLNPDRRREFSMQANSYQDRAMPIFREAMAAPTSDNCDAIVVFHHVLVVYTFATEQREDDLFLIPKENNEIVLHWLYFIRSACTMLYDVWDWVEAGPCFALAFAWEAPFNINKEYEATTLESLLALIPPMSSERAWTAYNVDLYKDAASKLATAFASSQSSPGHFTTWDVLRTWPAIVSTDFMALLQDEHPCALVLLAHYTVILLRIDELWYFRGRARSILRTVYRKLDPYWYGFVPPVLTLVVT